MIREKKLYHYGVLGMKWGVKKARNKTTIHDDYKYAHDKKSIKSMSTKELKERNKRLLAEQEYKRLTQKKNRGMKIANKVIAFAGTLSAADAAYKTYKKFGSRATNEAIDRIGTYVLDEVVKGMNKR